MPEVPFEVRFRQWYADQARKRELNPDPDDPRQFYDYRAAYRAGAAPDESGHWPSDFKKDGHPNLIVGGFDVRNGQRVVGTPRARSVGELVSLGWDAGTAEQLMRVREPLVPSHTSVDNLMRALLRVMSLRHD